MAEDPEEEIGTLLRRRVGESIPGASFSLVVTEGPDANKRFVLDGSAESRVLLGQSTTCAILLTDRAVSRRHAALSIVGSKLRVTDLESRNGTRVNGLEVLDAHLAGGELLQVGDTTLRVERHGRPTLGPLG